MDLQTTDIKPINSATAVIPRSARSCCENLTQFNEQLYLFQDESVKREIMMDTFSLLYDP